MLAVIGVSHHDVELSQIDRLSNSPTLLASLAALPERHPSAVAGVVTVATCNRLEVYLDTRRFHDAVDEVIEVIATSSGLAHDEVSTILRVRVGPDAVTHLFEVVAGMDSMVVGETEVSGQAARALKAARRAGATSPALEMLFQNAAHVARRIATEVPLRASGRTTADAALALAARTAGRLDAASVLLVGTGAYARVAAAALRDAGCPAVLVFSASGRQYQFAADRGLAAIGRDELADTLAQADLVIACSGEGERVLGVGLVEAAVRARSRPLCLVDLALRRDVDEAVRRVPGVAVIDLEDAAQAAGPAPAEAIESAMRHIGDAVRTFERSIAERRMDPAIIALREHVTATVEREMERLLGCIPQDRTDLADQVRLSGHRLTRALLHTPTVQAKVLASKGEAYAYVRGLHSLFGISVEMDGADPGAPQAPGPEDPPALRAI